MSDNQIVEQRDYQILLIDGEGCKFDDINGGWDDYGCDTDEYFVKDVEAQKVLNIENDLYSVEQKEYVIVKMEEVEKMIPSLVKQGQDLLENSEDEAITLLRRFNWNI